MNIVNSATETVKLPLEDDEFQMQHPVGQDLTSENPNINLNEPLKCTEKYRSFMNISSDPPQQLSKKQKLIWLQKRQSTGLWVQCDDCDRWRYLADILDSCELPEKWYCRMNPDYTLASCSIPEVPLQVREGEDLIFSKFAAGSVVWARMPGWPWWPAMVDDCPDTEQYYRLNGFSDIPTHFHVVFFDVKVTRAWITLAQLKHYATNKDMNKALLTKHKKYLKRLEMAEVQANDAIALPLSDRLAKYSFIARYKSKFSTPTKIFPQSLKKCMKRKHNFDIPIESSSDSDDSRVETWNINKKSKQTIIRKKTNKNKAKNDPKLYYEEIVGDNELKLQETPMSFEMPNDCNSMAVQENDNKYVPTMWLPAGIDADDENANFNCDTNTQGLKKETPISEEFVYEVMNFSTIILRVL